MRKLFTIVLLAIVFAGISSAQISGIGNSGCNGAPVTGTAATSATSNNTDLYTAANSSAYGFVVQLDQTTTITGGVITFQVSKDGGTNYVAAPVVIDPDTGATLTNPYTLVASTNKPFLVIANGSTHFRVRLTTVVTGSGTITPYVTTVCSARGPSLNSAGVLNVDASGSVQPASQSGTWNVRNQDGAGNALTSNSTTFTAKFALDGNLLGTKGTAFSTPGFVDVKVADGDAFVRQTTAANFQNRPDTSGATGAAPPARADFVGGLGSGATGGFVVGITVGDTDSVVNISTATTTRVAVGVSGRQVRITAFDLLTAAANNVAFVEGTGATCGTGTAGMNGGTTAASGWNFAANSGIAQGSGLGEVITTVTTGDSVCIVTSAATQLSGHIKYAIY